MPAEPAAEPILRVEGLRHSYGRTRALDGISLRVTRGEMFGLVGPDGAGKTTLLRILAGVIRPQEGRVWWSDRAGDGRHRAIGYLSQGFSLYQDLTVDENIEFFAEIHGVRNVAARSGELLSFVNLLPFRRRQAGRLSGGMKKKLALACALVHEPRVLLLDEPTTGVDPVSRRDFWMLLVKLLRGGLTLVMTTPYLDEAERSMRVGLLASGRFLAVDTPEAVKGRVPGGVLEIIAEDSRAAYRALDASGRFGAQQLQPFGDRLHLILSDRSAEEAGAEVAAILRDRGVTVTQVRETAASLENAFIALVRERSGG